MLEQALRIFVAMPGTDMGPNADYKDPKDVKENLLDHVTEKLRSKLGRDVELVIEKDKTTAGGIHDSMFAEARDAEVYIADLTGANPNVYLELGVRWALRDRITVVISQSVADLKFNVVANRAIIYGPTNIMKAASDITAAIESGLGTQDPDSPVRAHAQFVEVPRHELEELHARIKQLESERGDELFKLAMQTEDVSKKTEMLRRVVEVNPAFSDAFIELGIALREAANYTEAIGCLNEAVRVDPDKARAHRELGVTYNKAGQQDLAAVVLRRAIELAPEDFEAWSNLGGALRRVGVAGAEQGRYDRAALSEARDSYAKAHELKPFELYPALNVARIDILLSKWEPSQLAQGQDEFRKEVFLCRHMVQEEPSDWWRRFDLGDALLFSGLAPEAQAVYAEALALVPQDRRADVLGSVIGPMYDIIRAQVLNGDLLADLEIVITLLESAVRAAKEIDAAGGGSR